MKHRSVFTMRFHVMLMLSLGMVVVLMTAVTSIIALQASSRAARDSADVLFARSSSLVQEKLDNLFGELFDLAEIGAAIPLANTPLEGDGLGHPDRVFLQTLLSAHPDLYATYLAWPNGDFFQIINADNKSGIRATVAAPDGTVTVIRAIGGQGSARRQYWSFLDEAGSPIGRRMEPKPDYDPRTRDWFAGARKGQSTFVSTPYFVSSLQETCITAARAMSSRSVVFGADLSLSALDSFVAEQQISPRGFLMIYDPNGRLLAASRQAAATLGEPQPSLQLPSPKAKSLLAAARISKDQLPEALSWLLCTVSTWSIANSGSLVILMAAPIEDFFGPFNTMRTDFLLMSLVSLVIILPLTLLLSKRLSAMLTTMALDAERISRFDFSSGHPGHSFIHEFNQLSDGFSLMKETIASRSEALDSTQKKLKMLVDLGIDMSALRDIDQLCEKILRGAMDLTHAEGGSVYLRGGKLNQDALEFKIVLNDKLVGFNQGGTSGKPVSLPPVQLFQADGLPNKHNVVTDAFHEDKTINIPDVDHVKNYDFSGTKKFDQLTGYQSKSFLTVPLKPLGREVMGALQLINACNPATGEVIPFNKEIEGLVRALAAQAATALSNQKLINELEQLFESMIGVIVEAIDAKSPYTGGHNKRVPILAKMLAESASRTGEGPLAGWTLDRGNAKRQFHIAAMLHDCGKITTPEYVVDKATKLETIYNRINEIRTRFEVLLRDAMVEHRDRLLAGEDKAGADEWLAGRQLELQADFAFLAECNLGGEFMAPDRVDRLRTIAAQNWVRHFDDTLGLSKEELSLVPPEERRGLPASEPLLSDKIRHRVPREADSMERYDKYGFTIKIPELKYNRGEVYNLSVSRGTLTEEERFKINEHIMQTIDMLSHLCENADDLDQVVDWAGSHHETLKATGYPRKLAAGDLSIEARIMSIADIFEALTASDRPYKPAKTLSEAVKILFNFKKEGHIDPDLFDLFLSSGVYREYGEKWLPPSQIDEVDISLYIGRM